MADLPVRPQDDEQGFGQDKALDEMTRTPERNDALAIGGVVERLDAIDPDDAGALAERLSAARWR